MNALAMDLGGSSGKIFLGCYNGQTIEMKEIHRFHNGPVEDAGHLYWDIQGIYNNLLTGILKGIHKRICKHRCGLILQRLWIVGPKW